MDFHNNMLLDGFTVTGGNLLGAALHMYNRSNGIARNIIIRDHLVTVNAALIRCYNADMVFENIVIVDNDIGGRTLFQGVSTCDLVVRNLSVSNTATNQVLPATATGSLVASFVSLEGTGGVLVGGTGPALIEHSVLDGIDSVGTPGNIIVNRSASDQSLSAFGSDNLLLDYASPETGAPFVPHASGELMLSQLAAGDAFTSVAVDAGDAVFADVNLPDWDLRTTRSDLLLDAGDPDLGAHFDPSRPTILTFEDQAGTLVWEAVNADRCTLDGADVATADSAPRGAGRSVLTCFNAWGDAISTR